MPALSALRRQHVFAGLRTWICWDYLRTVVVLQLSTPSAAALKEAGDLTISLARLGQSLIHLKTRKCSWRITGPEVPFFSLKKIEWGIRGRLKGLALCRRECNYFNRHVLRASAVLGTGKSSGEQGVCGVCLPSLSRLEEVGILYS